VHGEDHDGFGAPHDDEPVGDDEPMRGWVSPDDRLWRHPSERAGLDAPGVLPDHGPGPARPQVRGTWVIGGLTVCVVLTLVVAGMVVAAANDPGSGGSSAVTFTGAPTTEVELSNLTATRQLDTMASSARDSLVALVVSDRTGTRIGTGVVAEAGGIIVALEPTVAGARSVTAVESDGTRQPAVLVGRDPATGIVVLRIPDDLPAAPFTDGDPVTGSWAMAVSEVPGAAAGAPTTRLYAGTVLSAGMATAGGSRTGLCATAIAAPLTDDDLGSPLVEPSGEVAGIFDAVVGDGRGRTSIFLPAELVRDVAAQIVSHGSVDHGVLGASVVDPDDLTPRSSDEDLGGAVVGSVTPGGSASQAGLEPGDRIVDVDGSGVRSVAELSTRLYADPPGTALLLTVVRSGSTLTDTVVLGN
jgi:S1-C subfamily serine protease